MQGERRGKFGWLGGGGDDKNTLDDLINDLIMGE